MRDYNTDGFQSVADSLGEERVRQISQGVSSQLTEANLVSFSRLSDEAIQKAVQSEISGTKLHDRLLENTRKNWFAIREKVTQGIIRGDSYSRIKRVVAEHYDDEFWKAARVVRTETHRTMTEGHLAAYDRAEARGIEMKRMWVAATDSRTRDRHSRLNETYADKDGFFEIDGMKARGPSQFGRADMDINCRCRVIGVLPDAVPESQSKKGKTLPFTGKRKSRLPPLRSDQNFNQKYVDWIKEKDFLFEEIQTGVFHIPKTQTKAEQSSNLFIAQKLVDAGWGDVFLLPRPSGKLSDGIKSPDAWAKGKLFDFKLIDVPTVNAAVKSISAAKKQAGNMVTRLGPNVDSRYMVAAIQIRRKNNRTFGEIWLLFLDGTLTQLQ